MQQYLAKLIFRIATENDGPDGQFDEQLRLIRAVSHTEAFIKANRLGHENEDHFTNDREQQIRWEFIGISDLNEVPELKDGQELDYHIREIADAEQFCRYIRHRSALLSYQV
ncbi:MAG: DUF4288 domain-containing protein [Mucilaginibacter polytrichastri]|nr:DUF4288 domain-containing protein [Mucilaginibacter polytrichastri]